MSLRFTYLKVAGAVGAAALTIGGLTAPAFAATQDITYNCDQGAPPLGPLDTTIDPGSIPASLVAGQQVKRDVTLTIHLNTAQTAIAQSIGTSVSGKVTSKGTDALSLTFPDTPIPGTPGATMDVVATGKGAISSAKAGSIDVTTGRVSAALHLTGGAGGPVDASTSCAQPNDGTQILGTVTVSKDASKTTTTASYNAKKDKATGKAKVKGKQFGLAGTGKVKFTLKKGTHKVASKSGTLNKKGVAKVSFKGVKKSGKYSISAKFGGDDGLKGSKGKDTFKVS
jgi:hypothetical protein